MSSSVYHINWSGKRIGDHCTVGDGAHASIKRQDTGIKYLTSKNFKDGRLDLLKVDYISEADYTKYFKDDSKALSKPKPDDVLFSIIGSMGEPYLFQPQDFFGLSSSVAILRPDRSVLFPKYLYYWIRGHIFQNALSSIKGGVAQSYVSLEMIRSLPLSYPSLPAQRSIAGILSAYDDLIENNTRRIKLLEEMAQLLYREWFVNFRFPGHQEVPLVESELGLIPQGWEIRLLPSVCEKVIDGTHDSPKPMEQGHYLVTGKHLINGFIDFSGCYLISQEEHQKVMKRSKPERGDIIFSNIGTLGSTVLVDQDFEFSIKNVALFKPLKPIYSSFLYLFFANPITLNLLLSQASGTSQKFISLQFFRSLKLICPPDDLFAQFDAFVQSILMQRSSLYRKNLNLRKTRDLLLPKLISGEIDVEHLDGAMATNAGDIAA